MQLVRAWVARIEELSAEILEEADARDAAVRTDADKLDDAFARMNARLMGIDLAAPLRRIGQEVAVHADKEVARTLAIDLRGKSSTLDRQVEAFVRENVARIRGTIPLEKMREVISSHHAAGSDRITLRNKLMDTFGFSRSRANLVARDQVLKLNSQITQFRQQTLGVTEYRWVTANDERVRDGHKQLDGKIIRWDDPPVVDERTGRRAHAGQDFQCRCTAVPVVDKLLRG